MMMKTFLLVVCIGFVAVSAKSKIQAKSAKRQIAGCVYKGQTYQTGQAWQDGCLYNCICENGATGSYKCTDRCPSYGDLPPVCTLVKKPGACCGEPQCNFQSSGGSSSGSGTGTMTGGGTVTGGGTMTGTGTGTSGGTMTGTGTMTSGVCVDKLTNCQSYTMDVCQHTEYAKWVQENCCAFCNGGTGGVMTGTMTGGTGTMPGGTGTMPGGTGIMTGGTGTMTGGTGTMTGGTGTMTGGTGTMTGGTTTCTDAIANCADYTSAVCTNQVYDSWVTKHCARFCNRCGATYTGTGGTMTGTGGTSTGTGGTITGTGTGTGTMTGGTGSITGTGGGVYPPAPGTGTGTMTGGTGSVTGTGGGVYPPGSGTGTMTGACVDKLTNCDTYDKTICSDAHYHDWVNENCRAWCGKCSGTGTGTGMTGTGTGMTTGTCTDKIQNCAAYTQAVCTNKDYATWVLNNCAHYCNKCGSTMTGTGGTMPGTGGTGTGGTIIGTGGAPQASYCMDKVDCKQYEASMCTDSKFQSWAKENCPATCNMCGGTGTTGTGTGTGTMTGGTMTGTCADVATNCAMLNTQAHICSDSGARVYAQQNCAMTCNMCGGTMTGTGGTMTGTGGTGGTMTGTGGTGGTMTGTGGTGGTMTGTGGTMTGTGGTGGTMTGGGSCSDVISNCASYDPSICTSTDYKQWATQNCARTCNLCSMITSGGTMTGGTVTGTGGTISGTGMMTGTGTGSGTGGTMTGSGSGCVYNSHLYQQGQSWKDGCKFNCQCVDASTGKYQCTQLCVQWQLPSQCHLNPPAPGKCCQTPSCPAGYNIQYPQGYTEQ